MERLHYRYEPWLASAGAAVAAFAVAVWAAPALRLAPVVAYLIGFSFVSASVLLVAAKAPAFGRRALPLIAIPALVLWLVSGSPHSPTLALSVTACLLLGASLVGAVVGGAIEHPGHLVFVAIVSSAADVFSVFHPAGPSHAVARSEAALSVLALPWPLLGTSLIVPFLGAGDIVFTAVYLRASRKHDLALRRTLLALGLAYAATMLCVLALELTLPALPFLGLAMVLAHERARHPPAQDRARGYALSAAIVVVVAVLFVL